MPRAPSQCRDMSEVRAAIDRVDDGLLDLLAQRVGYIERAAELKPSAGIPARAPDRVREVLARVGVGAEARGMPAELATRLWSVMIDWAIAHESARMSAASGASDAVAKG